MIKKANNSSRLSLLVLMTSASILASGVYAHAQTEIETVTVKARKVSEDVQDVPLTVNVLTAADLSTKGVEDLSQINGILPNVVWEDRGGSVKTKISIRGVPSGESNTGIDPGVGFYVDDVYQPNGIGFNQSLLDVDSVEVLKGPQGTLFGRNTTAGVVSIHTRRPSLDGTYLQGSGRVGDFDLGEARAVFNTPINDVSAFKISGIYRFRGGYDYDTVTGSHVNGENHYGGRAEYLYQPSQSFDLLASVSYYKDDAIQDLPRCGSGVLPGICPSGGPHVLAANPPNTTRRTMWGTSVSANWTPSDWGTITSITAFQHLDAVEDQDQDAVSLDLLRSGTSVPSDDTFTQEIRLATPQNERLRGVVGAYYLHEQKVSNTPETFTATVIGLGNGPTNQGHGITGPTNLLTLNTQNTDSEALFAQGSYDILPQLTAEIGARYSWDARSFKFSQTSTGTNLCFPGPAVLNYCSFAPFAARDNWSALSGTASLTYHFDDNALGYFRFSRGYKSGGWNGNQLSPGTDPTKPYDPEFLNMYEIGAKFESKDHTFILNGALFLNDYTDMQLRYQDPNTQVQFVTNAGSAITQGLELEATWIPVDNLVVTGNVGVQSTKITSIIPSPALGSLLNKPFPFAPHMTASATVTYTHPIMEGYDGVISATNTYRSNEWLDNFASVKSKLYDEVSGRIGIEAKQGWAIYLSGKNLTDVSRMTYFVGNLPWASNVGFYNPPRTWELEMDAKY